MIDYQKNVSLLQDHGLEENMFHTQRNMRTKIMDSINKGNVRRLKCSV